MSVAVSKLNEFRQTIDKVVAMLTERGLEVTQRGATAYVRYHPTTGAPVCVNIPVIPDNADDVFIAAIRGFIDHEVAHVLFTDSSMFMAAVRAESVKDVRRGARFKNLWNIVEDIRIERAIQLRFPGSAEHIRDVWTWVFEKQVLPALDKANPQDRVAVLLPALLHAIGGKKPAQDFLDAKGLWGELQPIIDVIGKPLVDAIASDIPDTAAALDLARRLLEAMENGAPPQQEQQEEQEKGGSESREDGEGESQGSDADEDENKDGDPCESGSKSDKDNKDKKDKKDKPEKGKSEKEDGESDEDEGSGSGDGDEDEDGEGDSKGGGGNEDGEDDQEGDVSDDASDQAESASSAESDTGGGAGPGGAPRSDKESQDKLKAALNKIKAFEDMIEEALTQELQNLLQGDDERYLPYSLDMDQWVVADPMTPEAGAKADKEVLIMENQARSMVGQMAIKLRRLLAQKDIVVNVGGQRSGRIDPPALFRVATGDERVFMRREEHQASDTAVTLLVDCSGSMVSRNKIDLALLSAYVFSQTLDRLGIPHEVLGFTTRPDSETTRIMGYEPWDENAWTEAARKESKKIGRIFSRVHPITMIEFKRFGETFSRVRRRFGVMRAAISYQDFISSRRGPPMVCMANTDGESLVYAVNRLLGRREQRKVMMVFSDGRPSSPYGIDSHLQQHLIQTVKACETKGVETIGIGIMDQSVRHYYPKHVVIDMPEDLPTVCMRELTKALLR